MTRLAANLTMMFTELPFLDRFDAAAAVGFKAVECGALCRTREAGAGTA